MTDAERFLADDPPFATPEEFAKVMKERDGEMRLIDADALKARARTDFGGVHDAVLLCKFADEQPTIDPVRHGRWIPNYGGHNIARCSACQKEQHVQEAFLKFWTYCPSCGAKMDGAT